MVGVVVTAILRTNGLAITRDLRYDDTNIIMVADSTNREVETTTGEFMEDVTIASATAQEVNCLVYDTS
jgi:hypothetical protein